MIPVSLIILLFVELVVCSPKHSTSRLKSTLNSDCKLRKLYNEYKETHAHIRPAHEERARLGLFLKEIKKVLEFRNNPDIKWEVGISFMADMTEEEEDLMRGTNISTIMLKSEGIKLGAHVKINWIPKQSNFWVAKNTMGPIRNQAKGSCWAHAAAAVIDAQLTARSGTFHEVSVQELYDCAVLPRSKEIGGHPFYGLEYVKESKHLSYELGSPETNSESGFSCDFHADQLNAMRGYEIEKIGRLTEPKEQSLLYTLHRVSPVTADMVVKDTFLKAYMGGVYSRNPDCGPRPDHAVVIVAYSENNYIIRNSWGTDWGVDGYLFWDRLGPLCSLLKYSVFPYLEKENTDWSWPWPFNWNLLE